MTGMIPIVIPTFTSTWNASIDVIPTASRRPNVSLASLAISIPRHRTIRYSKSSNAPPINRDAAAIRYSAVYCWNPIGEALAGAIARRMAEVQAPDVKSNGVIYGNLAVTRNPEVPSCLIEADFITNPAGEEAVWNPECRRRLAEAIAAGFADWHKGTVQ